MLVAEASHGRDMCAVIHSCVTPFFGQHTNFLSEYTYFIIIIDWTTTYIPHTFCTFCWHKTSDLNARFVHRMVIDDSHQPNQFDFFTFSLACTHTYTELSENFQLLPLLKYIYDKVSISKCAQTGFMHSEWAEEREIETTENWGKIVGRSPNVHQTTIVLPFSANIQRFQWINNMLNDEEQ